MGFIQKILGGLFKFLGGLLKIFGIGKKSEYFMEIDDSQVEAEAPAAAPAAAISAEPAKPAAKSSKPEPKAAPANPAPAIPAATPTMSLTGFSASKPKVEETFATDFLINPKLVNASRRRPGPSLSMFKDMARQVGKTPSMG